MPEIDRLLTAMVTSFAPDGAMAYEAAKRLVLPSSIPRADDGH